MHVLRALDLLTDYWSAHHVGSSFDNAQAPIDDLKRTRVVKSLAAENIHVEPAMLREGVNRDVAFSDDHHASHSPVIWNHTVVTENMRLSDLGHLNHAGQLVQQVEDRFYLSEDGRVVDETIDDKMKHWGWSFLRCPTNVTNRGTHAGANLHVWQVKVSTHATAKASQRPPKAGTKEYQSHNGGCVP
jgi:hypothetical protein